MLESILSYVGSTPCLAKIRFMPQYDLYHGTVKNALAKDGWVITDDPFTIEFKGLRLYADLGAEKLLAAEKHERKVVLKSRFSIVLRLSQN